MKGKRKLNKTFLRNKKIKLKKEVKKLLFFKQKVLQESKWQEVRNLIFREKLKK
jgi:hypothetical protein